MKRVLIVYHYVAHYREAVFKELIDADRHGKESGGWSFDVAASSSSNVSSIRTINPSEKDWLKGAWVELENIWLGEKILWQKGLLSLIGSGRYEHIIFLGNVYFVSTWLSIIFARFKGVKVHLWTHGLLKDEKGVKWYFRKLFYSLSHTLLLYGNTAKQLLEEKGVSPKKCHVVYNSLDYALQCKMFEKNVAFRNQLRNSLSCQHNSDLFLYIGRVTSEKKLCYAAKYIKESLCRGIDSKLVVIGDGPYLEELKELAFELGIQSYVFFLGACYDEDLISRYIISSDVLFVPGDVGLTAIHSLTYGTPVVTHNKMENHKPEHEAITDGYNGSFVDLDNYEALENSLQYWAGKKKENFFLVSKKCQEPIDRLYNPKNQADIIKRVCELT